VVEKKKALILYIWTLELLRVAVRHHSNFCTGTDRVLKLPGRSLEGAHIIITADICLTEMDRLSNGRASVPESMPPAVLHNY
jgi:ABC-type cobalamin transport system permease subunit